MRIQRIIYGFFVIIAGISTIAVAVESPVSSNPLGLGTVPPSAYKSGLIPSIRPVGPSGNLIVTGEVAGGKYFRGVVPYRGVTDFGTSTSQISPGTVQVENFMRYSSGTPSGQTSGLTPYYSPIWTVSKIPAGSGPPLQTSVSGTYAGSTAQQTVAQGKSIFQNEQMAYYNVSLMGRRPLTMSRQELQRVIDADITRYPLGGTPAIKNDPQNEFWKQMRIPVEQKPQSSEPDKTGANLIGVNNTGWMRIPTGIEPNVSTILNLGRENPAVLQIKRTISNQDNLAGTDVFEQIKLKLGRSLEFPQTGRDKATHKEANEPDMTIDNARIGAATSIAEAYKSFAAYSDDKFNRYMKTGEDYLKQGRYYRAADSYTIAIAYKPGDPLGYAGKSHALFAAGEYLSSALFLSRALEIFPDYANIRIDLVAMLGDKDLIEKRLIEAREWFERSKSAELAFLLSYIYCQMDRLEFARQAIEFAAKEMPDSKAVMAMKQAVAQRLAVQN